MATVVRLAVVPWTEAENLARSVRDGRPGKGLELPKGTSQCPMKSYRTRRVSRRGAGTGRVGQRTRIAYGRIWYNNIVTQEERRKIWHEY